MASILSAGTTSATALNFSADTSGVLQLASNNGTVGVTLSTAQNLLIGSTTDNGYKLKVVGGNASTLLLDNGGQQYTQLLFQSNGTVNTGGDILIDSSSGSMNIRGLLAGPMVFYTSASAGSPAERMRINASGYVTTPSQPSFYAFLTSGPVTTLNTPIIYNSVQFNTSSSYNNSNGRFTAPVAGTYIFFISGITNSGTTIELGAYLNASTQIGNCRQSGASAGTNTGCSTTFSWPLNAGDYVDVRVQAGNCYGGGVFTNFGGYLVG